MKFTKEAFEFDEINNLERYKKENENNPDGDLNNDIRNDDPYRQSLLKAYKRMDRLLARGKGESSKVRWSGTTSCNCIIVKNDEGGLIHIANCGKYLNHLSDFNLFLL